MDQNIKRGQSGQNGHIKKLSYHKNRTKSSSSDFSSYNNPNLLVKDINFEANKYNQTEKDILRREDHRDQPHS